MQDFPSTTEKRPLFEFLEAVRNPALKRIFFVIGALGLIYVIWNLFVLGGDNFIYALNNNISIPLALLTTFFSLILWRLVNKGRSNRLLWGGLMAGWALWTLAEVLWVVYGYYYQDIPYPSPADFFWLVGYIPMLYGLYARIREIPVKLNRNQNFELVILSLITLGSTFYFILLPILQQEEAANWVENVLNVLYPLVDLVLLLVVFRLLFVYINGEYSLGWNLLTLGFILHSTSNLIFSYASLYDLYYPNFTVNLVSSLAIDVPYNLSYVLWALGLHTLQVILRQHHPLPVTTQPETVSNASLLLFLGWDHKVISVSNNFNLLFDVQNEKGKSLSEILGIPNLDTQNILEKIRQTGKIADYPVTVLTRYQSLKSAYLSGIATHSPSGKYTGCNLVVRLFVENDNSFDEKLSADQKYIATHLLRVTGSQETARIRALLLDYHQAYLKHLYNLMHQVGGAQLAAEYLEHLQQVARENQWKLQFDREHLILNSDYPISLLQQSLPVLMDSGRQFSSRLTDPVIVDHELGLLSSQFSEAVHQNVAYYIKKDWK